jgi:hypothetical protein
VAVLAVADPITIDTDGQASGKLADGHQLTTVIPPRAGPALLDRLMAAQVEITAASPGCCWARSAARCRTARCPVAVVR